MQKNDFEKNVQQRMDDLQLYPSAGLWPEVERRIRKEKKRRWFIFWILFPLLLIGTGTAIYFLATTNKKNIVADKTSNSIQQPVQQTIAEENRNDTTIHDQPVLITIHDSDSNIQTYNAKPTLNVDELKTETATVKNQPQKNDQSLVSIQTNGVGKKKKKDKAVAKVEVTSSAVVKKEKDFPEDTIVTLEEEAPIFVTATKPRKEVAKNENDSINQPLSKTEPVKVLDDSVKTTPHKTIVTIADSSLKNNKLSPLTKKNPGKWKWGVTLITGLSNRTGTLLAGEQKRFDNFTSSNPVSGPAQSQSYTVELAQPRFFLEGGIYIQKNSKKRTSISAGLTISSFSHGQNTGAFKDSAIGAGITGYYFRGNSSKYGNRYYYLQIPVLLHWQLSGKNKFPLVWQNGFSPSLLLGTNALVYHGSIYYKDKSVMNKLQLAFRTGLYTRFAEASKHPVSAGLFFNYNLTGFQKTFKYDRNHHISVGIQLMMQLKKD